MMVLASVSLLTVWVARGDANEPKTVYDDSYYRTLYSAGRYDDALVEARKLLAVAQKRWGANSMDYARALNRVANVYNAQGKYGEAEQPYRRVIAIVEKAKGGDSLELSVFLKNLGFNIKALGRYDEAAEIFGRDLAIKQKAQGPWSLDVAAALNQIANVRYSQRKYDEAEGLYRRVIDMVERLEGTESSDLTVYLDNLANTLDDEIRYNDSAAVYSRELAIQERDFGSNSLPAATALKKLGTEYWKAGRLNDAEPALSRALSIFKERPDADSKDLASAFNQLGIVYTAQIRLPEAEENLTKALAINERIFGSDSAKVATNLNNLGIVYTAQDRLAEAETAFKRAIFIRKHLPNPDNEDIGLSLRNLGDMYYKEGRYAEAEEVLKESVALDERLGANHPDLARALTSLALLYGVQAKYADAEALLSRALAIHEKSVGLQHPSVATTLEYLAVVLYQEGKYAAAESLLKRAINVLEGLVGPNHPDLAIGVVWLGVVYQHQNDYPRAEALFARAVELKERALGPDHNDVGTTLTGLGNLYYAERKLDDAQKAYTRALTIKEHVLGAKHPEVAGLTASLANIYYDERKYPQAEQLYKRALEIYVSVFGSDNVAAARTQGALANLYKAEERYAEAEELYWSALAIYEKTLGPKHEDVASPLNNLIDLHSKQHRYVDALPLVRRTIGDGSAQIWASYPVLLAARSNGLIDATEAADDSLKIVQNLRQTSASEALNALAVRFSTGDSRLAQLVRRDQDLTSEETQLGKAVTEAVSKEPVKRSATLEQKIKDRLAAIAKERETIERDFVREFPDYAALSKPQTLPLKEIQSLLAADEALVVVHLETTSYVWVITSTDARWSMVEVTNQQAVEIVGTLRTLLDPFNLRPFDPQMSFRLYKELLGQVDTVIASKSRLSFVLDGALTSLPLQVLVTADPSGKTLKDVEWLVRRQAITVLPSVASLRVLRGRALGAAQKPLIGFADPVFDPNPQMLERYAHVAADVQISRGMVGPVADVDALRRALPPLPDTVNEVRQVATSLHAAADDVYVGPGATETQVKQATLDEYRVVYFATHGLLAGEVSDFAKIKAEPALVLTLPLTPTELDDGLLTASEIAQLKLDADWVVLSACNTAAGDKPGAEALSGLARAFIYAGGRSLLVSNWEVETKSAVALMVGTFAAFAADPKLSHGEALRKAMLAIIDDAQHPEWVDPKFWAPFIVVGEPAKPAY
jgi:CHAT domain-containing protein/Tfp pilus assembly protein PilF